MCGIFAPLECFFNMANAFKGRSILKKTAKKYLGPENDLLLGLDAQLDYRPGFTLPEYRAFVREEKHGNALRTPGARKALFYFLSGDLPPAGRPAAAAEVTAD